jgi:hypothetical protein
LGVYRIHNWDEYRKLALEYKPSTIFYSRDPHPLSKPPWGPKLIFYNGFDGYVFTDSADEGVLHKTGISIRGTDSGSIPILVEDIESFLKSQIENVKVSPIWFPG